jgi:DNA-binding SARP family transcriptional activator
MSQSRTVLERERPVSGLSVTTLRLLRAFELRRDQKLVLLPPGAQRLIAFLALEGGMLKRVYVAGTLWIDYSQESANANLRTALWRLRQLPYPLVKTTATHLSLSEEVAVDVHQASEIATHVTSSGSIRRDEELEGIVSAGELLPDWYDDWLVIKREWFRQARLHALEELCHVLIQGGRYGKAIQVGLAAVACEPLRESAHRAVMRAHLAEGNCSEALRQYALCRGLLDEIDLEPSAQMEALRLRCGGRDGIVTGVM